MDALGAAADPRPRPGMRAVLLVFSASKLSQQKNIGQGLCARAAELRAPLYGVWSARTEPSAGADIGALASLAAECGGYSVNLENSTGAATLLAMIATQRTQYRLEYRSSAASASAHTLAVAVSGAGFKAESPALSFTVDVRPPAVAWVDFPGRLVRAGTSVSQPAADYLPASVDFQAAVSFPDGHPRRIVAMQLFADGRLVGECAQSPCDGVRWNIREYAASASVSLRLTVRDELGLQGQTPDRTLALVVRRPSAVEVFRAVYLGPLVVLLAVAAAAGLLVAAAANLHRARAAQAASVLLFPPGARSLPPRRIGWRSLWENIGRRAREPEEHAAYAILDPVSSGARPLAVSADDVLLGRDERAAALVLADPSVAPRHARIARMGDGIPWVFDLGSAAGSWINFEEIPPEGAPLHEGDRLDFGRVGFRVRLKPLPATGDIADEG